MHCSTGYRGGRAVKKQKCVWCGTHSTDLMTQNDLAICKSCVLNGIEIGTHGLKTSSGSQKTNILCDFCGTRQQSSKKVFHHKGIKICNSCLAICKAIVRTTPINPVQATSVQIEDPFDVELDPSTPADLEWRTILQNTPNDAELLKEARKWLKEHALHPNAWNALLKLLSIKKSPSLVAAAKEWLTKYPDHQEAPCLLSEVLRVAPNQDLLKLAASLLDRASECFPVRDLAKYAVTEEVLFSNVSQLLERDPYSHEWEFCLLVVRANITDQTNTLLAKWLRLNESNSSIFLSPHIIITESAEVISAAFNWLQKGGRQMGERQRCVGDLVRRCHRHHRTLLPEMLSFARAWVEEHPTDQDAGQIHGTIIWSTHAPSDIQQAIDWYSTHRNNRTAWFVPAEILAACFQEDEPANQWAVTEARSILRKSEYKVPRLIGELVSAHPDDESIAWAKEEYARSKLGWILIRLIEVAPDSDSISEAIAGVEEWKNSSLEPEMLHALLRADPKNKLATRRAKTWLKRNTNHSLHGSIAGLMYHRRDD
jgi:hypothetical protein